MNHDEASTHLFGEEVCHHDGNHDGNRDGNHDGNHYGERQQVGGVLAEVKHSVEQHSVLLVQVRVLQRRINNEDRFHVF